MSCSGKPAADDPLVDQSFLTQQPCAAPCWYGLEPAKSSESEVYATLNKLPFVDPATIKESTTTWFNDDKAKEIDFDCLHPKDSECGGILIIALGKLARLTLNPPYPLTFQTAVEKLGPPNYLDYHPVSAHGDGCFIMLTWSHKGVYITNIDVKNTNQCDKIHMSGRVPSDITVTQINYVTREVLNPGPNSIIVSPTAFPGFAKP